MSASQAPFFDAGRKVLFQALAARIVPETQAMADKDRQAFFSLVEDALSRRPAALRAQFGLFLGVLRWAPVLRYGRPFLSLDGARQDAFLRSLQSSPVDLLRKGFWGLKVMVFMGYYGRPEGGASVGWRPSKSGGNEALLARRK